MVGEGKFATDIEGNIRLPEEINIVNSPPQMVQGVFGEYIEEQYFASRAIICVKNDNVDEINDLLKWLQLQDSF